MLLIKFLIVLSISHSILSGSELPQCKIRASAGKICTKTKYLPEQIITESFSRLAAIRFLHMSNDMHLTIPVNYHNTSNSDYSEFQIVNSCVQSIEENYFHKLDKNKNILNRIQFIKVNCLKSLSTKSFSGIGNSVEFLKFNELPDLVDIDWDFFNTFTKLRTLEITKTQLNRVPEAMLTFLPNLGTFKIYSNQLTEMPSIPASREELIKNFEGYWNPFNCKCSLMKFIDVMKNQFEKFKNNNQSYTCETPEHLTKVDLIDVGDLCFITTNPTNILKSHTVTPAGVKIEIIAAIAGSILIVVLIVIIVCVCKKKKKSSKKNILYNEGSPSKIVFQDDEFTTPFIQVKPQKV